MEVKLVKSRCLSRVKLFNFQVHKGHFLRAARACSMRMHFVESPQCMSACSCKFKQGEGVIWIDEKTQPQKNSFTGFNILLPHKNESSPDSNWVPSPEAGEKVDSPPTHKWIQSRFKLGIVVCVLWHTLCHKLPHAQKADTTSLLIATFSCSNSSWFSDFKMKDLYGF